MTRKIIIIAFVISMLCAIGGYLHCNNRFERSPVPWDVGNLEIDIGLQSVGTHEISTTFQNCSPESRRILGAMGRCDSTGCIDTTLVTPFVVAAGESVNVFIKVRVTQLGNFELPLQIFLEENGIRTVTIRVTGTAVEAPRAPK